MATILVVDDEAPIRRAVRRYLDMQGHSVVEAEDGVDALNVLEAHDVDVAIVDLMMPRMDGLELMSRMKVQHGAVKVVAISAIDKLAGVAEREKGAVTTLKKPFELAELADALQLALGLS